MQGKHKILIFDCRASAVALCRFACQSSHAAFTHTSFTEVDGAFPTSARRRAEDILAERKKNYHIRLFSGVEHGFAVRGDLSNKNTSMYCSSVEDIRSDWVPRMGHRRGSAGGSRVVREVFGVMRSFVSIALRERDIQGACVEGDPSTNNLTSFLSVVNLAPIELDEYGFAQCWLRVHFSPEMNCRETKACGPGRWTSCGRAETPSHDSDTCATFLKRQTPGLPRARFDFGLTLILTRDPKNNDK